MGHLLTNHETAEFLRVSPRTINRDVANGMLRALRLSNRVIRFEASEVQRFLSVRRSGSVVGDSPEPKHRGEAPI